MDIKEETTRIRLSRLQYMLLLQHLPSIRESLEVKGGVPKLVVDVDSLPSIAEELTDLLASIGIGEDGNINEHGMMIDDIITLVNEKEILYSVDGVSSP